MAAFACFYAQRNTPALGERGLLTSATEKPFDASKDESGCKPLQQAPDLGNGIRRTICVVKIVDQHTCTKHIVKIPINAVRHGRAESHRAHWSS